MRTRTITEAESNEIGGGCTVYFYSLADPITNEICYIGETTDIGQRYQQHCETAMLLTGGNKYMFQWIFDLYNRRRRPVLGIIETSDDYETWKHPCARENEIIKEFWKKGAPLLNRRPRMEGWLERVSAARYWKRVFSQKD